MTLIALLALIVHCRGSCTLVCVFVCFFLVSMPWPPTLKVESSYVRVYYLMAVWIEHVTVLVLSKSLRGMFCSSYTVVICFVHGYQWSLLFTSFSYTLSHLHTLNVDMTSCVCLFRLNNKGQFSKHFSQFPTSGDDDNEPMSGASHVKIYPGHVILLQREHKEHSASKPKTTNQSPRKSQAPKGQSSKSPSADNKPVESERARQLKEKNKAKRANHNRKAMADKKRSRGMGAPPRQ